jgi:hypothetical protein
MYFPYLRGRIYELLALRELAANDSLGKFVVPVIEPVKLSPTLNKTISEYVRVKHPLAVIENPVVGSFIKELEKSALLLPITLWALHIFNTQLTLNI